MLPIDLLSLFTFHDYSLKLATVNGHVNALVGLNDRRRKNFVLDSRSKRRIL